ncbi:DUF2147 domain-containing protein [Niabella sp. 22666]|uniref:DUF2147 domain-containing protein n=1 Tax=Niabella sp. 22666 TaxID=3453954 RepID=UPI003F82EB55
MVIKNCFVLLALTILSFNVFCQSPVGTWKTIDDNTGKEKSQVRIYETKSGKLQGEVVKILEPGRENAICTTCTGIRKDKPVKGMTILWGLKKDGDEWSGGQILDPEKGKQYKCTIKPKGKNELEVRGYIGISLIGRTQVWQRVQ